jgi:hypothetical protein
MARPPLPDRRVSGVIDRRRRRRILGRGGRRAEDHPAAELSRIIHASGAPPAGHCFLPVGLRAGATD